MLKLSTAPEQQTLDALRSTKLYKLLVNDTATASVVVRPTADETQDEFIRLQRLAKTHDKALNKALAKALEAALQQEGHDVQVTAEKASLEGLPAIPDILVKFRHGRTVCLEPTWRTTGKELAAEGISKQQNTLSVGHIQQYFLQKLLNYAKGLSL